MKKYEYMILYEYPTGKGRVFLTLNYEINSKEDIKKIDKSLRSDNSVLKLNKHLRCNVYVSDFKLLRVYVE